MKKKIKPNYKSLIAYLPGTDTIADMFLFDSIQSLDKMKGFLNLYIKDHFVIFGYYNKQGEYTMDINMTELYNDKNDLGRYAVGVARCHRLAHEVLLDNE